MTENTVTLTLAFNWKLSVLGLLMLPLLLRLGFWQLERAEEKQQLNSVIAQQHQLPPVTKINQYPGADLQYRKIQLQGYFDQQRYWLLDNKTRQGRVGYEVIVPFVDSSGATILINRGWIAASPMRSEIPIVDLAKGMRRIEGFAYQPSHNVMTGNTHAESVVKGSEWPKRIQKVDIADLYRQLNIDPKVSYLLRLETFSDAALVTQWRWINSSPQKHQGYAVQWFAMASVLLVALLFANSNLAQVLRQRMQ